MAALKWLVASRIARCEGVGEVNKGSKVNGSTSLFYFYWIAAKVMFSAEIQEASSLE